MGTEVLRPHGCLIRTLPAFRNASPNPNPRAIRREGAKRERLVMGRVTILKRGESLEEKEKEKAAKGGKTGGGSWDPAVFGPDRLGPDPELIPKEIRLVAGRVEADWYAGSAFAMSPSPRAVPIPSFWRKREGGSGIVVDNSATKDLRRLLRLED